MAGYFGGHEGAAMMQGVYLFHLIMYSVLKGDAEIINLLKRTSVTIIPALNIDVLEKKI